MGKALGNIDFPPVIYYLPRAIPTRSADFFKIPMSENDNFRYFKMPMSVCLTVGFFESVGKLSIKLTFETAYKTDFSGC